MGIIYGLFDPRTSTELKDCRYVGLTNDPPGARLSGHISTASSDTARRVYKWIRSLLKEGINPVMLVFQDVPDDELDASECAWVAAARYSGADLTNGTDGGRGQRGFFAKWHKENPNARSVWAQAFCADPDKLARRNQRIKEGHAKIDKSPTMCPCGAGPFAGQYGVDRHAQIKHQDQDPTECECGEGPFIGQHGLNIHLRACRRDNETVWCVECQQGPFDGVPGIAAHRMHKHSEPKQSLMCECGAGPFVGLHGLNGHIGQAHNDPEPMWCECGEGPFDAGPFKGSYGLATHRRYCD